MRRLSKGSNLVEYVLPTAIVGIVVGLALYSFVSGGNLLGFIGASGNIEMQKNTGNGLGIMGKLSPKSNLANNPVQQCSSGSCSVDFGDFILSGIPENFSDIVEAAGTSGGTKVLANLLNQIGYQLDSAGKSTEAGYFKDLANLTYFSSQLIKKSEQNAVSCNGDVYCLTTMMADQTESTPPANISSIVNNYGDPNYGSYGGYGSLYEIIRTSNIGQASYYYKNPSTDPRYSYDDNKNSSPAYAAYDKYLAIMASSDITPAQKNVATTMVKYLSTISTNYEGKMSSLMAASGGAYGIETFDVLEGTSLGYKDYTSTFDDVLQPKTSAKSSITATLICVTGKSKTDMQSCF
jgi:hypothetical protein